jgi:hypothetical protein
MIAALFIETGGVYWGLEDVDPWDKERDARLYAGPYPCVAHPPCERWGRYWYGGPSAKVRRTKGDDGGCFEAALAAVELWGGVLEHPEASAAWRVFGLHAPPRGGGWVTTRKGWTCCVEQGHYGHRARKATWLYAVTISPPSLRWGRSLARARLDDGFHSSAERRAARALGVRPVERLSHRERAATPIPFRDLLLGIASGSARWLDAA